MLPPFASTRHLLRSALVAGAVMLAPAVASTALAGAQVADSARVGLPAPVVRLPDDSLLRPPISPRRAFLSSLLFPGSAQAVLRRPVAGTVYVTGELVSLFMLAKSIEDLRLAKVAPDSITVDFERDDEGEIIIDPGTGDPIPIREPHPLKGRVRPRRQHVEDWVAMLIFNHFFSGADAFVAAHLWEVPARVSMVPRPDGYAIAVSIAW